MPIWIRIIILLVCYLIYLTIAYVFWCKKKKETFKSFLKLVGIQTLALFLIMYVMFPDRIFFSYSDVLLAIAYLFISSRIFVKISKEKENDTEQGILARRKYKGKDNEDSDTSDENEADEEKSDSDNLILKELWSALKLTALLIIPGILIFTSVFCDGIVNPSEKVNVEVNEYESVGPTINIKALECYNRYDYSIGYVETKDSYKYFYYFRDTVNGKICRQDIWEDDIEKSTFDSMHHTKVIVEKTSYDLIYPEMKKTSDKYKEHVVEEKYILQINPAEVIEVKE